MPKAVFFPTRVYRLTAPLKCGPWTNLIGETRRSRFLIDHDGIGMTITSSIPEASDGGDVRIEKLAFFRAEKQMGKGINIYLKKAPQCVLDAVQSCHADIGIQAKDSHICSFEHCTCDHNKTGYLDEGRNAVQTWTNSHIYSNEIGVNLRSEHTFVGGAIELNSDNDALVSVTPDYENNYAANVCFVGVHFEAQAGKPSLTVPNILIGPDSYSTTGEKRINTCFYSCIFHGNSSQRPAISINSALFVTIHSLQIRGYGNKNGVPVAAIIAKGNTERLITSAVNCIKDSKSSADIPVYSIDKKTKWTNLDGDAFETNFPTITDPAAAPPASVKGKATIYIDNADNNLKIIFGDGTVKTIVTKN